MTPNLLPCPFCGGEPNLTHSDYVHDDLRPMPVVECKSCSAWVRAEGWNHRAKSAPDPVQNQCDGCSAGVPLVDGMHRMGKPGGYSDPMRCQAAKYATEPVQGEAVAFACTANKKCIAEHHSLWRDEQGADDWLAHMVGRGCVTTKTPLYTAAAKPDAELVALLTTLRKMVNATPLNDIDCAGVWFSTHHPLIERIDAKLASLK